MAPEATRPSAAFNAGENHKHKAIGEVLSVFRLFVMWNVVNLLEPLPLVNMGGILLLDNTRQNSLFWPQLK